MLGGAAGDALGYPVEFMSRNDIVARYGRSGIRRYETDRRGLAPISDDTQMSLFTANGILMGQTRGCMRGIGSTPEYYVKFAYRDWLHTQMGAQGEDDCACTWIRDIPELNVRRAPGTTCLQALAHPEQKNNSKGCGGIMRVAPMAMFCATMTAQGRRPHEMSMHHYAMLSGEHIAKLTHHHPLGYIPAAMLNVMLYDLAVSDEPCDDARVLEAVALKALRRIDRHYRRDHGRHMGQLRALIEKTLTLAHQSDIADADAVASLGEGWVAEETLAIALLCVLRHPNDFEQAVCAAVNHSGDSDSTGAVCGNIVGAMVGARGIPNCYTEKLELRTLIESMAHDLSTGCIISEYEPIDTPEKQQWLWRYCEMEPAGWSDHT